VAEQQFEYGFDDIGNRKVSRRGGDGNGWNLRESLYTANLLNHYSQRTVPGYVDILGVAFATNLVYVNSQIANRKGEYFWKELSMNNTTGSVWQPVTVTATGLTTVTGNVFMAKTPEVFSYDLDGNMISDGRWNYTWDAENRLIKVESRPDTPSSSWRRIEWTYDALGRRIQQVTSIWTNNAWFVVENLKFVSDPMLFSRHIVEINGTNNAVVRSYVWGLDLSGTMDGAGGVGGLAWVTLHTASGPVSGIHFTCYDGNGNIVALVSATTSDVTARYEYSPFGEPIRISGPAASLNAFRFSTKRTENNIDLVLYEYRVFSHALGRWGNRDPLGERGFDVFRLNTRLGENYSQAGVLKGSYAKRKMVSYQQLSGDNSEYQFVFNKPIVFVDLDGRDIYTMQGNDARSCCGLVPNCVNNSVHISVCVDTWEGAGEGDGPMGRACFSFGCTGFGVYGPKSTWLGWSSWTFTCLEGEIYQETFTDGKILRRPQDHAPAGQAWLNYIMTKRLGTKDGYSVARHNCRKYSNMEFDDAPKHYGP
jgi:RHS repeat-associated protein